MQIASIILYSKDGRTRRIDFSLGRVSIVTGGSKRGKSALLEIVDYCLGREQCHIPVGPIRSAVSWYGILLQLANSQIFVARQPPETGSEWQSAVFLRTGPTVTVPAFAELQPTTNIESLEALLTGSIGIAPNLNVAAYPGAESSFAIGFRHTTFYMFQQQDEIASKKILFHRQAEEFIPPAIRQTFPYFVGAIGEDRLVKLSELDRLQRQHEDLARQIAEYDRIVGGAEQAVRLLREATQLKMIEIPAEVPQQRAAINAILTQVVTMPEAEAPAVIDDELDTLQRARFQLLREYRDIREEIRAAEAWESEQIGYSTELQEELRRLKPTGIYRDIGSNHCPVCLSEISATVPTVAELQTLLADLQQKLGPVEREVPNVRKHIDHLYDRLQNHRSQLDRNWADISAQTTRRRAIQDQNDIRENRRFVQGRISLYLQSASQVLKDGNLEERLSALQTQIEALQKELDRERMEENLVSILNSVGVRMSNWGKGLNLEFAQFPLRIDPKKLTIVADTNTGPVTLDRMGSGENWVGYHLVALMALHAHFAGSGRPVPRFLMLDQPSQAHYPEDQATGVDTPDEDRQAVRDAYRFLVTAVGELNGALQVIVVDHANIQEEFFQSAVVARWRGDEKLIPMDWINPSSATEVTESHT